MILTYKVKHGQQFVEELKKARKVAKFAINNRNKLSTKYVKHIGLQSAIACQVLRKFGRNRKCKTVSNVKLIVPNQHLKYKDNNIYVSCLKLSIPFKKACEKINQIELDNEYVYISITVPNKKVFKPKKTIGIDRNTTGHIAVASCIETGKVYKLGKKALHIHKKYKHIRKSLQKKGKFKKLKQIKKRESNIIRNLNHNISKFLVDLAIKEKAKLVLENLKGIKNIKAVKSFKYALHSWGFYQLQMFLEYKAQLAGVSVEYIDPYRTSKCCSRCGLVGNRNGKKFVCGNCQHVDHADSNAGFCIGKTSLGIFNFREKAITKKGVLKPRKKLCILKTYATLEPHSL